MPMKGHEGWDDYADYYDWENAQTVGRRDIAFWQRIASSVDGAILERAARAGAVARETRARRHPPAPVS